MFEEDGKKFAAHLELLYRKGVDDGIGKVLSWLRKIKSAYDKADNKTPHSSSSAEYHLLCGIEQLLEEEDYD